MSGVQSTRGAQGAEEKQKKQTGAVQAPDAYVGRTLHKGEYAIESTIGRGGMGQVFLASHRTLDVPVALKQARADQPLPESVRAELDHILSQEPDKLHAPASKAIPLDFPLSGGSDTDRFLREALLLARLRHPSIPTLYDYFLENGYWYLVMEYVPGPTLAHYIRQYAPLPPLEALNYTMQLCDVLDYLHKQTPPVIFRDLKPSNVILSPEGRLALIDFGIARYFKEGQINDTTDFGSPGYASPEQYEGTEQTDGRSDLYSLGVILYEMLSGRRPVRTGTRGSPLESLRKINPALSPALAGLVSVATRIDPMYRFQTASAFYSALERTRALEERRAYHRHALLAVADETVPDAPSLAPSQQSQQSLQPPRPPRASVRAMPSLAGRKGLEEEALAMQLASLDDSLKLRVALSPIPVSQPGNWTPYAPRSHPFSRRSLMVGLVILVLLAGLLASVFALAHGRHPAPSPSVQQTPATRQPTITVQPHWEVLPSLPSAQADNTANYMDVQGHAFIYVSGGYRGASATPQYVRGLYRYDIVNAHWEMLAIPGFPTMGNNAAAVDDHQQIYFTSGYSADAQALTSLLYRYDPLTNTLVKITPPSQVHLGFGNNMVSDQQGHLYITEGFRVPGNPHALAGSGWYRYDTTTGQWAILASLPGDPGYTTLAPDGQGGILMIGGAKDAGQHLATAQIYRYDTLQNTWSLEPSTAPTSISGAASCFDGQDRLVIAGGYDATHNIVLSSTWLVTLPALSWQKLPDMPPGGSLLGAAACDSQGHMFLERGANNAGQPTGDYLELTV